MADDAHPELFYIIPILLIMIFNALVVASKRALDYIDRNVIKEMAEDNPEDKKIQSVMDFLAKPSKYHYANHAASFISIVIVFILFNILMVVELLTRDTVFGVNFDHK